MNNQPISFTIRSKDPESSSSRAFQASGATCEASTSSGSSREVRDDQGGSSEHEDVFQKKVDDTIWPIFDFHDSGKPLHAIYPLVYFGDSDRSLALQWGKNDNVDSILGVRLFPTKYAAGLSVDTPPRF
jgi:hypothetical protein